MAKSTNTRSDGPRLSTLEQERSRETRRKLIQAATRLWRERGFDETTVSEVCDAAGVSKGTFYFYFVRKEDLLLELAAQTSNRVGEDWSHLTETDAPTEEVLRQIVEAIARRTKRTPKALLERIVRELLAATEQWQLVRGERSDFGQVFRGTFSRAQGRGEIAESVDPHDLAAMVTILLLQGMLIWARGRRESLEDILWRRTEIIFQGAQGLSS